MYDDMIDFEKKSLPRQQDKYRERHKQAAINAPAAVLTAYNLGYFVPLLLHTI